MEKQARGLGGKQQIQERERVGASVPGSPPSLRPTLSGGGEGDLLCRFSAEIKAILLSLRLHFWALAALFKMTTNLKFLDCLLVQAKRSLGALSRPN